MVTPCRTPALKCASSLPAALAWRRPASCPPCALRKYCFFGALCHTLCRSLRPESHNGIRNRRWCRSESDKPTIGHAPSLRQKTCTGDDRDAAPQVRYRGSMVTRGKCHLRKTQNTIDERIVKPAQCLCHPQQGPDRLSSPSHFSNNSRSADILREISLLTRR